MITIFKLIIGLFALALLAVVALFALIAVATWVICWIYEKLFYD